MNDNVRSDWIDATYDAELGAFAAEQGVPRARVEETFREHCDTFRSAVVDGTSAATVRNLAFRTSERRRPNGH